MKTLITLLAAIFLASPAFARTCLTANMTMYVNGDPVNSHPCGTDGSLTCGPGSDSGANDCLSSATPCLTMNNAVYQMYSDYDQCGFTTIINMAHGASQNYAFTCGYGALPGNVTFEVVGDYTNPTAVNLIAPPNQYGIITGDFCVPSLSSFEITDSGSASGAIFAGQLSVIDLRSMTFAGNWNLGSLLVGATNGGRVNWLGQDSNSTITNTISSTTIGQALQAANGGAQAIGGTINIPNAITMQGNQPFAVGLGGQFQSVNTGTFTGYGATHATGHRCQMDDTYIQNDLNPNTLFPGSINCTPYGPF